MHLLMIMLAMMMTTPLIARIATEGTQLLRTHMADARRMSVTALANEIDRYRRRYNAYPASLTALVTTPGFEHARAHITIPGLNYAMAGPFSDGTWQYTRAAVAGIDVRRTDAAIFFTGNTCGSGSFSTARDWCGASDVATWYKSELRNFYIGYMNNGRTQLDTTLNKFIGTWNTNGKFPAGSLSVGGHASLASLVGYAGNAANCSGMFNFSGIPLGCEDLYTPWGAPVVYNYIAGGQIGIPDTNYIALLAVTPNVYAGGGFQPIAAEMHY